MGDDQNLNLAAWFIKLLSERKFQGLVWENEVEKIFQVPWSNQKKKDRLSSGEDSQLVIEWAKHKYHYKDGDQQHLAKWKTNLRCAINKCPDITRLKDRDTDFYIICQFKTNYPARTDSTISACSSTSQSEMDYQNAASVSSMAMSESDYQIAEGINTQRDNLPNLLWEEEMSSLSNDSNFDSSLNTLQPFSPDSNSFPCFSDIDYTAVPVNEQPSVAQHYPVEQQQIPKNCIQPCTEQESDKHIMIIEVSYDSPQRTVMCRAIKADSPDLRVCSVLVSDSNLISRMYETHELIISIPSVESVHDLPDTNKSKIVNIINNFQRGVSIKYIDNNIWIERKSKVKVFATNEGTWCNEIKRKAQANSPPNWVKIFDYGKFLVELQAHFKNPSYPCPKDYVLLTIGHYYHLDKASPLSTVLVCIKIRHVQAANDLKVISNGTNLPPDPMISGGDSLDKQIEERMNNLNIR